MDPNAIGGQFTAAAQAYANGIQPHATKLFVALLFIEILVTAIQYMTDQGDAPRYIGRLFRHLFSAGFIYLMLINAFPWMTGVMKSFSAIGAAVSGVPNLSPSTVLDLGGQMAETIYNTPASTGMIPNFSMALGQTVAAFCPASPCSFSCHSPLSLRSPCWSSSRCISSLGEHRFFSRSAAAASPLRLPRDISATSSRPA